MAISFTAISPASGASQAACITDLHTKLIAAITAHAKWTTVEDLTNQGTATWRWTAIKCAAAATAGTDFYLIIHSNATSFFLYMAEGYDSVNHRISKCAALYTAAAIALDANGYMTQVIGMGSTGAGTIISGTGPGIWQAQPYPALAANMTYSVIAYDDHVLIGIGTTSTNLWFTYAGAYETISAVAANDPTPLVIGYFTVNTVNSGFTRDVTQAGQSVTKQLAGPNLAYPNSNSTAMAENQRALLSGYADRFQGGVLHVSKVMVYALSAPGGANEPVGTRGRLKDILTSGGLPTGAVQGDTVAYNGTQWMLTGPFNAYLIADTGVAA